MTAEKNFFSLYEEWHKSPQGAFALQCGLKLTKKMLSHWPRRGHSFLQIYFDAPKVVENLWQSGFDVSAVVPSSTLTKSIDTTLRHRIEMHHIAPKALDNLPFNDKSFDYVALTLPPLTDNTAYPALKDILHEALRLAVKGILFQGWNSSSLEGIQHRIRKGAQPAFLQACPWYSWREICRILRQHERARTRNITSVTNPFGNLHIRSSLMGFSQHWEKESFIKKANELMVPLPLGALMQVRLHLVDHTAITSTPLRITPLSSTGMQAVPVAERRHSYTVSHKK